MVMSSSPVVWRSEGSDGWEGVSEGGGEEASWVSFFLVSLRDLGFLVFGLDFSDVLVSVPFSDFLVSVSFAGVFGSVPFSDVDVLVFLTVDFLDVLAKRREGAYKPGKERLWVHVLGKG